MITLSKERLSKLLFYLKVIKMIIKLALGPFDHLRLVLPEIAKVTAKDIVSGKLLDEAAELAAAANARLAEVLAIA
jgi:hypothetical protein